jgi:hydrogenase maturation protein HypF
VPDAIDLGFESPPLLAVGADLKNAFCLSSGRSAILSQHIGDLESLEAQTFFQEAREHLESLFRIHPRFVAHDLHPRYHSTEIARRTGLPAIAVQHHHAHIASCLTENGRRDRVIGVAWDGTGYGPDGTVWGGEILLADLAGFERAGLIRPVPLPGGDAAVREPWRMALSHLISAGLDTSAVVAPLRKNVEALIRTGVSCVATSSAGRLFDAVAAIAGVRDVATYEGQAAMELEAISAPGDAEPYPFPLIDGAMLGLDPRPLISAIVADLDRGVAVPGIAARFHAALAQGISVACSALRRRTGLGTVALSGGCFHNRRLTEAAVRLLERDGFEVLLHSRVPPGDGGIALGQAAVAAWRTRDVPGDPR